jgi:hypothetical protein
MLPVREADKLTTILCRCHEIWKNLNFLEPSGPLQACNGTALPFFKIYLYNNTSNQTFNSANLEKYINAKAGTLTTK